MTDCLNKYHLCCFNDLVKEQDLTPRLQQLWSCNWSAEYLNELLEKWLQIRHAKTIANAEELLCLAIECALIFIQYNFTGDFANLEQLAAIVSSKNVSLQYQPFVELQANGEEINPNVKLAELLLIAKQAVEKLMTQQSDCVFTRWWHLRLIVLHQQIIDDLTQSLYEQYKQTAEFLLKNIDNSSDMELLALLYLEIANGYLLFHRAQKSNDLIEQICSRLGVTLQVEGLLGVRTKFQQKPLPQLCLKVVRNTEQALPSSKCSNESTELPKLLLLEDDTRLERIRFIEASDNEVMSLPSVLQALVLAKVKQLKRSQPKDRLADEELEPYIQTLLYQQHGPLQVRQSVLLLNCIQESNHRRTVERSWKQCEEAVKLLSETTYTLKQRLSYGFAVQLQPKWQVQMQLCELLVSLGMTKTALDIYLQIQAWEQVIECYTRLELRHKAAEIIQQQLNKQPTVLLYCLLGDATDEPSCYETAWEFSKHCSGKAKAHWGMYYFRKAEYEQALPHLQQSVEINSLQEKIWLRLGFAAIQLERWELAVHAYITYTHLEPNGFESWNNLAKALIKLGDRTRAHKVLSESLKCNYSNWKVWENFMVVSVDTCHWEDAINAYNRLSDLKTHYLDLEVLCITIASIAEGKPDAKGQSQERLLKKATTLMGQQCIKHGSEAKVWELAALIATTPLKRAEKLVKAQRAHTTKELEWITKQDAALKALQLCKAHCEFSLEAVEQHSAEESEAMITSQLNASRLAAQACIRAVEKHQIKWDENEKLMVEIQQLQEQLTELVKKRMS